MKVGRELDALIAEKVMGLVEHASYAGKNKVSLGWRKQGDISFIDLRKLKDYSTNIKDAWEVVEKTGLLIVYELHQESDSGKWLIGYGSDGCGFTTMFEADSAPLAICLAALKSIGVTIE